VALRIPLAAAAQPEDDAAPAAPEPAGPGAAPRRLPVVVSADDDPAFAAAFGAVLNGIAERVVQVADGAQVLDAARREQAAAIFLDLEMPAVDGYEVVRLLKADPELCAVPVVVVTAYQRSQVDRARLAHVRAVLAKDALTVEDLVQALGLSLPPDGAA
jgi:CheY-like chemotaxis protein